MRSMLFLLPLAIAAVPAVAAEVVPVAEFESVQLRGGGSVAVRPGPAQRVTILSGSSQFTNIRVDQRGQLKIDACNERCPRNYDLRIEIQSPDVPDAAISGGGAITVAPGYAPQDQLSVAVNGGGQIDVRQVSAGNVSAAVNGGGKILTGRSSSLSAAINGGGEVRYAASGQVNTAIHGGGNVRRGD
ncbi:MAG: GIN domain-containing protein [Sphingomicrobium sp.]